MITPKFSLSQTDNQLIINIHAPYTNVKDTEIHVNDDDFRFFSSPYYLRLTLPGDVEETDNSSAKYYTESNSFIVTLDKKVPGQFFDKLDMLTLMLQPKSEKKLKKPMIEVLSSSRNEDASEDEDEDEDEEDEDDDDENYWMTEQNMEEDAPAESLLKKYQYGFANYHSGLANNFEEELSQISQIRSPDDLSPPERKRLRLEAEVSHFSDDQYLYDLMENAEVEHVVDYKIKKDSFDVITSDDQERMIKFRAREFKLDSKWQKRVQLGLFDLVFAYVYDLKVTKGKHCVESPWNIARLSSTLSWFDVFDTAEDVVRSVVRRSLTYPLYRNWQLTMAVLRDTVWFFKSGGAKVLLKCVLDIHKLFSGYAPYYLLNQLYIEDYCTWIQTKCDQDFVTMANAFEKVISGFTKADAYLDLVELEAAALAVEDEEMNENISEQISGVTL